MVGACAAAVIVPAWRFVLNFVRAGGALNRDRIKTLEGEHSALQARLDSRPSVTLVADGYNIVVVNDGGEGLFRAQFEVLGNNSFPIPQGTPFHALWSRTRTDEATIFRGERADIVVGDFSPTSGRPAGAMLRFHYWNVSNQRPMHKEASYLLEQGQLRPLLRLRLKLYASPPLEPAVVREVVLQPDGITLWPAPADPGR